MHSGSYSIALFHTMDAITFDIGLLNRVFMTFHDFSCFIGDELPILGKGKLFKVCSGYLFFYASQAQAHINNWQGMLRKFHSRLFLESLKR